MAILLQEEKKPVNWIGMLTALFIVVAIFVLAYFLFFKKPEIIDQVTPKNLENINQLSKVRFNPDAVIGSPSFQSLEKYAAPVTPRETPGKANPFRP
jgi:hypothetical protein